MMVKHGMFKKNEKKCWKIDENLTKRENAGFGP